MDMGSAINLTEEVVNIFSAAQLTAACHQKNSLKLRKIYFLADFEKFFEALLNPLNHILQIDFKQKNVFVERLIEFFGVFCAALKAKTENNTQEESFTEDPLVTRLFNYLLENSKSSIDVIRFRSCQIINKILDHLVGADISDDLCNSLENILLDRLWDTKNVIRLQAIVALFRLQDPVNPEDRVIPEFMQLMNGDIYAKVRQYCVEKIAVRKDVIDSIAKRIRDIDPNVRLAAYKRLTKMSGYLKITERRTVLFSGMLDPSEKVNQLVFSELLESWLEQYDNNILALLKAIRLDGDEKDIRETTELCEQILNKFYFKTKTFKELNEILQLNDHKLVSYEHLNWETAIFWRSLIQLVVNSDDLESYEDNLIPEVVHFCKYVLGYTEYSNGFPAEAFLEKQYIIRQLFLIIKTFDVADPASRQCVNKLVKCLLMNVDLLEDVAQTIIGCLENTIPNVEKRCEFICEIISDLLYPIDEEEQSKKQQDTEYQLSKLKVQLNCLQEEQNEAVSKSEFIEAERLKQEIADVSFMITNLKQLLIEPATEDVKRKDDPTTINKCLVIANGILQTVKVSSLPTYLKTLKSDLIEDLLVTENDVIKIRAFKCYAACCIYDKPTARNGIHIFAIPIAAYQAGDECDTQILLICISAVVDLIRIYGADLMAEPQEDDLSDSVNEEHQKIFCGGTSLSKLIQGLVDLMSDEQYEIQEIAGLGLCKLILSERIHSPSLISRLVLKWCNPAEEDQDSETLKQLIGYVLEQIPYLPNSSEQLEGAVLLTINTLANAPRTSPLADVDIENIAKFVLALCKVSREGEQLHSNIALIICQKILEKPRSKINSIYSKVLLMLQIPTDRVIQKEIIKMCELIRESTSEKIVLNYVSKFMANVSEKSEKISVIIEEEQQTENGEEVKVENMDVVHDDL